MLSVKTEQRKVGNSTATGYELQLILSCSWLEFRRLDTSCSWLYPAADSSCGCWMRVATDSILRLTWVPAAGNKLQLIPSYSWLEFWWLDRSCGWFHHTADSGSSGWIRVAADSILRLFRVPVARYELQLIPSCGWLRVAAVLYCRWLKICLLDSTYGWHILWYIQKI